MNQKYDILDIISRGLISTKQLINKIKEIFKESGEGVMLSTIHKTKGLENKTIYFLCPELIPSRFATKEWQLQLRKYIGGDELQARDDTVRLAHRSRPEGQQDRTAGHGIGRDDVDIL